MKIDKRTKGYKKAVSKGLAVLRRYGADACRVTIGAAEQQAAHEVMGAVALMLVELGQQEAVSNTILRAHKVAAETDARYRSSLVSCL
jgi:hypothetical protein